MIKFVYFDVGGVVILDFSKTDKFSRAKKLWGIKDSQDTEFNKFFSSYEIKICTDLDIDNLVPVINKQFNTNLPPDYSLLNDFINNFEVNPSIWPVISEISLNNPVGLLTDMYPRMFLGIKNRGLVPDINWQVIVDSSIVKLKKPDPKIYQLAQDKCGFKGKEILFIDNNQNNLDGAMDLSWQTFFYDSANPKESSQKLSEYWYASS